MAEGGWGVFLMCVSEYVLVGLLIQYYKSDVSHS